MMTTLLRRDGANAGAPDMGPGFTATTIALVLLALFFVGLRFWARHITAGKWGPDDWTLVAATVVLFIFGGLNIGQVAHGMGRHADTLSQEELIGFFKLLLAFECVYVTVVMLVKASILVMYHRIFPPRGFRLAVYTIAAIVVAWWLAIVLVCIFQCRPVSKAWVPWAPGVCIDLKASFIGNAVPNIITDIAILVLPITQVWSLHGTVARKLSLCGAFLLGSFVLIASIYRFTTIMQFDPNDTTWTLGEACTWCIVECACGVISACLPTLRPLVARITLERSSGANSRSLGLTGGGGARGGLGSELVTIGGTGGPAKYGPKGGSHTTGRSRANSLGRGLDDAADPAASAKHPYAVNMNDSDFFDSSSEDHHSGHHDHPGHDNRSPASRATDEYPLHRQDV